MKAVQASSAACRTILCTPLAPHLARARRLGCDVGLRARHGLPSTARRWLDQHVDAEEDQDREDEEQQDRGRGAEAELVEHPHLLPQEVGDRLGRGAGAAEGEQHDRIEQLQRLHRADDDGDDDGGLEQRQLDAPERLPGRGAHDAGGVDELSRQGGEAGQEDQEGQRGPLPDVGEDDRPLRGDRMRQPADARVDAEALEEGCEDLVERPAVDVDHREIVADHDRHDHHRYQEYGGVELLRPRAPRHQHCQHEAENSSSATAKPAK